MRPKEAQQRIKESFWGVPICAAVSRHNWVADLKKSPYGRRLMQSWRVSIQEKLSRGFASRDREAE